MVLYKTSDKNILSWLFGLFLYGTNLELGNQIMVKIHQSNLVSMYHQSVLNFIDSLLSPSLH